MSVRRLHALALILVAGLPSYGEPLFDTTVRVRLGADAGQSLGSLFEARDSAGKVRFGAGFDEGHSTYIRDNARQIVFYCKPPKAPVTVSPVSTPYGPEYNATRTLADKHGLVVFSRFGTPAGFRSLDAEGRLQPYTPEWAPDDSGFCGLQYVNDRPLVFFSNRITYDGQAVYTSDRGSILCYYAKGSLFIFHYEGQTLSVISWAPGTGLPANLDGAATFPLEGSIFVFGTYGDEFHLVTNIGNYYIYTNGAIRRIRESDGKSWQAYSMVRVYDDLFIGHYPTGSLYVYDEAGLRLFETPIPVPAEVSPNAREAQTLAIHGGYLYAGVWPWGELWRYDPDNPAWEFVARVFDAPPLSKEDQEPYAAAMKGKSDAYNYWGQRISSLTNVGDSMFIATMNKQGKPFNPAEHGFITQETLAQYGRVHRLESHAQVVAPFTWKDVTSFRFVCDEGRLKVFQDGQPLADSACDVADIGGPFELRTGNGIYGPFAGTLE